MVVVRVLSLVIWLGWLPFLAQADAIVEKSAAVEIRLSPQKVLMGQPIVWRLTGEGVGKAFIQLDLSFLAADFVVAEQEVHRASVRVVLYPLRTGQLHLPEVDLEAIQMPAQSLTVASNPDVQVVWQVPKAQAWQKQWLAWQAQVRLADGGFQARQVLPDSPDLPLIGQSQAVSRSDHQTQRQFVMMVRSVQVGEFQLPRPYIEVQGRSPRKWRFYPPQTVTRVKSLPSFIPADIPVGQLEIVAEPVPSWSLVDGLLQRQWRFRGMGVIATEMPVLTQQLTQAMPQTEWLLSHTQHQQFWTAQGFVTESVWQQPYRLPHWGKYDWPELQQTFFNPQTGKLETLVLPRAVQWGVPVALVWLIALLGGGLSLLLLGWMSVAIWVCLHLWFWRRRLAQVSSATELWQALRQMQCLLLSQSEAQHLADWRANWQQVTSDAALLQKLEMALNQAFYQPSSKVDSIGGLQILSQQWAQTISCRLLWQSQLQLWRKRLLRQA